MNYYPYVRILCLIGLIVSSCKSISKDSSFANVNEEKVVRLKIKKIKKKIKLNLDVDEEDITEQKNFERLFKKLSSLNSQEKINTIFEILLQKNFELQEISSENDIRYTSTHSRYHQMIEDLKLSESIKDYLNSDKSFRLNSLIDEKINELKQTVQNSNEIDSIEEELKILGVLSLCLYHPRKIEIENYFLRRLSKKIKILSWKNYANLTLLFRDLFKFMPNKTNPNNLSAFTREFFDFKTNRLIFDEQKMELNFILPIQTGEKSVSLFIYDKNLLENTPINEIEKITRKPIYLSFNKKELVFDERIAEKVINLPVISKDKFPDSEMNIFEREKEELLNADAVPLPRINETLVSFQRSEGNRFLFIRSFQPFVSLYYNEIPVSNLNTAFSLPIAEIASNLTFTVDYASEKEVVVDPGNMAFDPDEKCLYIPHLRMIDVICIQTSKGENIFRKY